ncbi:MAG: hypothetical protein ACFB21_06810 [Opitutales bacterium]
MAIPNFMQCWFGELSVYGTVGGAQLHPLTLYQNTPDGGQQVEIPPVGNDLHAGHRPAYAYLFDCIRNRRKPEGSSERAVSEMKVLDAIYASAAHGGAQAASGPLNACPTTRPVTASIKTSAEQRPPLPSERLRRLRERWALAMWRKGLPPDWV